MNYGHDVYSLRQDSIEDSIRRLNELAYRIVVLRDRGSDQWELRKLFRSASNSVDDLLGVARRVQCKVAMNGYQVIRRGIRPVYNHGVRPKRLRTSSTESVRPSSLSFRPASIA
jgi:hypothetical protein